MKITLTFLLIALTNWQLIAQDDVQFSFEDISFENKFEEEFYNKFLNSGDFQFEFLFTVNNDSDEQISTYKSTLYSEIGLLKQRKIHRNRKKDIKYIYDYVHQRFLKRYSELAYFDEIFKAGTYNCVSAVALYALVFEELKIPYVVKETPTHVYIIAEPETEQLLIETTDPNSGFASFSPGFKQNFVGSLIAMKLISDSEVAQKGLEAVFDEFYFGGKSLKLRDLSSLQYYNKGVNEFNEGAFKMAYETLKKAYFIYPNEQTKEMLKYSIINTINQSAYQDWSVIRILPDLEKFVGKEISILQVEGEFSRMLQYTLINSGNDVLADSAFNWFVERVSDSTLKQNVRFSYNRELAVVFYNRADFKNAYNYARKAYQYNPNHMNSPVLLLQAFASEYQNRRTDEAFKEFEILTSEFPELFQSNTYTEIYNNLLLSRIFELLDDKQLKEAESFRTKFEESLVNNNSGTYDENLLANAYSFLSLNYFKKGYTTKAKQIVAKGLSFKPDNNQLKSAKQMLNY
jgi:tetratricopeptide (TPR) repeat protein